MPNFGIIIFLYINTCEIISTTFKSRNQWGILIELKTGGCTCTIHVQNYKQKGGRGNLAWKDFSCTNLKSDQIRHPLYFYVGQILSSRQTIFIFFFKYVKIFSKIQLEIRASCGCNKTIKIQRKTILYFESNMRFYVICRFCLSVVYVKSSSSFRYTWSIMKRIQLR